MTKLLMDKFFQYLDTAGLLDKSIIILTSDSGMDLLQTYVDENNNPIPLVLSTSRSLERVLNIPLLVLFPKKFNHLIKNKSINAFSSHIQLFDTILDLSQLRPFLKFEKLALTAYYVSS